MPEQNQNQTNQGSISYSQLLEAIRLLKEPSAEEKQKLQREEENRRQVAQAAVESADTFMKGRVSTMRRCSHKNRQNHAWVANNLANGDTVALCQICGKDYRWRTSDEQKREGVDLYQLKYLTEENLKFMEKQFPPQEEPDRVKLQTRAGVSKAEAYAI